MARQLVPLLGCEGPNDRNFLLPLLRRLLHELAVDVNLELNDFFLDASYVTFSAGSQQSFTDWVLEVARTAEQYGDGDAVLLVHTDADADAALAFRKIRQARERVGAAGILPELQVVAVVPVREIEAWLLADPALLGEKLNPAMPVHRLGLPQAPEALADPKAALHAAHQCAHDDQPRRRPYRIEVSELYEVLGTELALQRLRALPSFAQFEQEVRAALMQMGGLSV